MCWKFRLQFPIRTCIVIHFWHEKVKRQVRLVVAPSMLEAHPSSGTVPELCCLTKAEHELSISRLEGSSLIFTFSSHAVHLAGVWVNHDFHAKVYSTPRVFSPRELFVALVWLFFRFSITDSERKERKKGRRVGGSGSSQPQLWASASFPHRKAHQH